MERNRATAHADRMNRLLESFRGATQQITATLERASEDAAQHCPKQGQWSAEKSADDISAEEFGNPR